uniref:Amino acid permease/ SLC12A domain-containing protein n=1 Tax=Strongyloides stercoralis TaxID=6248 RepID=A0A0K0DZF7_STRER
MAKKSNKMGLFGAISYIIGNIVGSGIFITPTGILQSANSIGTSIIIWIASAFCSTLGAFNYVELGTSIRESGCDFSYITYVKWYPIAFSFMFVGCVIIYPATLAVQALAFSTYIFKGFGICTTGNYVYAEKLLGFCLMWLLMFLNFFSIKKVVSKFQIGASISKILTSAIIIVTGFYYLIFKKGYENFKNPFQGKPITGGGLVTSMFSGLYSYDGWDILNFGLGEVDNPKRTMPLAIIFGMSTIAFIYVCLNVAYFSVLTVDEVLSSTAIATTFAQRTLGDFQYAVPFLISIVLIGSMNSTIFSASRYLQSASRKRALPSFIACTNYIHDSPRVAILVHIIIAIIISFVGDLDQLINYVSFCQWFQRGTTMIALLYIRFFHIPVHSNATRMPIIMHIIFVLICGTLTIYTIVTEFNIARVGLICLAAGLLCYILFKWNFTLSRFELYKKYSSLVDRNAAVIAQVIFNGLSEIELPPEDIDKTKDEISSDVISGIENKGLECDSISQDSSKARKRF